MKKSMTCSVTNGTSYPNISESIRLSLIPPEFGPLVDQIMLHEGCSKKNPVVFEQFRNDFCPSWDNVTECAMYKMSYSPLSKAETWQIKTSR